MDYLRTAIPSQLIAERGSNLVVINPGSANIRIGLAPQDTPLNVPHCIARYTNQVPKRNVQDQLLNCQVTTAQHMQREKAYDIIASLLKIPFLDEEVANNSFPRKIGRIDGSNNPQSVRKDTSFAWTNVFEEHPEGTNDKMFIDKPVELTEGADISPLERKYRKFICGEEALKISPDEPYCLHRPIRRGHFNISKYYSMQQVYEDLHAIWDWLLTEKLHIPPAARYMFSALVVLPETFDNREIKEVLSLVLRDLQFSSAVMHQEGLAAAFGNGLSTACIVSMGAQVTSVVCIEDGVALPTTEKTLPFGGEDISRCLLWTQRHHQTWPQIHTDMLAKPIDLLMLNALKDSNCYIREGEVDALAIVSSYDSIPPSTHRTRLTALNVPPMGLFYPSLFIPDVFPPPPRTWFNDYEDMLEDTWHLDYPRRPDVQESLYPGINVGLPMWDSFPVFQAKPRKEEKVGLAEAITKSILSTGRIDLQRKLFCSIQLIGGVALTGGLIPAMEERVLHAIPSNEAIDTVEVLQLRLDPTFVSWKGGVVREASILRHPLFVAQHFFRQLPSEILGVLDYGRDAWIHREDWIKNGIHLGSGRKYKDSYFVQAQANCYINS